MGLQPLFVTDFLELRQPSIYAGDDKYIAGYEKVTKEELRFVSLA